MTLERLPTLTALLDRVLHDPEVLDRLLKDLSINVTEMFRDPSFFRDAAHEGVPAPAHLPVRARRGWPAARPARRSSRWPSRCSEEGLLERTRIYATDMNEGALARRAPSASCPLERMRDLRGQLRARGRRAASGRLLPLRDGLARLRPELRDDVVFAQHNLASDRSFNEFHLILCRNVMIYFGRDLQRHVHELFLDSLSPLGLLGAGAQGGDHRRRDRRRATRPLDPAEKLFRRQALMALRARGDRILVGRAARRCRSVLARAAARVRRGGRRRPAPRRARGRHAAVPRCWTSATPLPVREADDKDALVPGVVLVAPPGYHLLVEPGSRRAVRATSRCASAARRSTCSSSPRPTPTATASIGVVLTGANADGADGLAAHPPARRAGDRAGPRARPSGPRCRARRCDAVPGAQVMRAARRSARGSPQLGRERWPA